MRACVYRAAAAAAPRARGHAVGRDGRRLMGRPEVDQTPESQCRGCCRSREERRRGLRARERRGCGAHLGVAAGERLLHLGHRLGVDALEGDADAAHIELERLALLRRPVEERDEHGHLHEEGEHVDEDEVENVRRVVDGGLVQQRRVEGLVPAVQRIIAARVGELHRLELLALESRVSLDCRAPPAVSGGARGTE